MAFIVIARQKYKLFTIKTTGRATVFEGPVFFPEAGMFAACLFLWWRNPLLSQGCKSLTGTEFGCDRSKCF